MYVLLPALPYLSFCVNNVSPKCIVTRLHVCCEVSAECVVLLTTRAAASQAGGQVQAPCWHLCHNVTPMTNLPVCTASDIVHLQTSHSQTRFCHHTNTHSLFHCMATGHVSCSFVCLSVCLSVCFHFNFWVESPLTLTLCMCIGHDHNLWDWRSRSKVKFSVRVSAWNSNTNTPCRTWKAETLELKHHWTLVNSSILAGFSGWVSECEWCNCECVSVSMNGVCDLNGCECESECEWCDCVSECEWVWVWVCECERCSVWLRCGSAHDVTWCKRVVNIVNCSLIDAHLTFNWTTCCYTSC